MHTVEDTKEETLTLPEVLERAMGCQLNRQYPQACELYALVLAQCPQLVEVRSNFAAALQGAGRLDAAVAQYREAIDLNPNLADLHRNLGTALQSMGLLDEAMQSYRQALDLSPVDSDAMCYLGAALNAAERSAEAEPYARSALKQAPRNARAHNTLGAILQKLGKLDEAISCYEVAVALKPDYVVAKENLAAAQSQHATAMRVSRLRAALRTRPRHAGLTNDLGNALRASGAMDEAIECYRRALRADPMLVDAHINLGAALAEMSDAEGAIACYRQALRLAPERAEIYNNLGVVLKQEYRSVDAVSCLREAVARAPRVPQYLSNLAGALFANAQYEEAITVYHEALALAPEDPQLHCNIAEILNTLERTDEALAHCRQALAASPNFIEALRQMGLVWIKVREREEAVRCFREVRRLNPRDYHAAGLLALTLAQVCSWDEWAALQQVILDEKVLASGAANVFALLTLESTPAQQLIAARAWLSHVSIHLSVAFTQWHESVNEPLRIGYLSADFRIHPVAYLSAELFELHDRSRVEVFAYSVYGSADRSEIRSRIAQSAHHFIDVETLADRAMAERIRADRIDVLVDLTGHTEHARPGVLALRPAPVQVNFLGYPGTMGAPFIDYIITDRFVTPPHVEPHFSERFVYMPHSFQPNDRKKVIAQRGPSLAECGLPEHAFVFCSFNKTYKLNPRMFDVWMRLLVAVPDSVLWLSSAADSAVENLQRYALARGVDAQRLIFAPLLDSMADHLARHRHADLFLDTLPYNAHTTASDALWAGLPVLTCAGDTFASRVAGSLLHAVGLPELVTHSLEEYESLALALARDPVRLNAVRARLQQNRLSHPLFDSARYTRDLETAYQLMSDRYRHGLAPQRIEVPSCEVYA